VLARRGWRLDGGSFLIEWNLEFRALSPIATRHYYAIIGAITHHTHHLVASLIC
jgi:hypothetical protein